MATRSAVWGEVFATIRSTPVASISVALLSSVLGFLAIFASVADVQRITDSWNTKIASGSSVLTVTTATPAGLSAARCELLNDLDSVVAAGGRTASSSATSLLLPSRRLQIEHVTPGYPRVVWPGLDAGTNLSVVASSLLAKDFGLAAGLVFGIQDQPQPLVVTAVASAEPRIPQLQNSLTVAVADSSTVEACLVEAAPSAVRDVEALLTGWFGGPDPVNVFRMVPPKETDQDPQRDLSQRLSMSTPAAAGCAVAALAFLLVWARRKDFATYRLAGATRRETCDLFALEFALLYCVPLAGGVLAQLIISARELGETTVGVQAILIDAASLLAAATTAIPVTTLYLSRLDPMRTLKGE
ncbi:hypothetical protein [Sinomonas gamaensis]|uniref:hypothetical protein n=1 Tax=Sinomonas gamaensis TaxID=2565624 RepID=UPI001109619F|nr:hypothetical protein [Sinomonas gamaensis]